MYVVLEALDGPSVGARTNVAIGQTVRIGREAGNDFVVPQDPTLSRCHFHLTYDGTDCTLRNQSRYGTFINNRRVDSEDVVQEGDELRAGVCRFSVRFASDESIRKSTSPEMPVVLDEDRPYDGVNHAPIAGLPPVVEDEPIASPAAPGVAPAVYGLPPIEEEEPVAEPGQFRQSPAESHHASEPHRPRQQAQPRQSDRASDEASTAHLQVRVDEDGSRVEPLNSVLERARLEDEAKDVAMGAISLRAAIDSLAQGGMLAEALKVLAAALSPQGGVRWACRCVREAGPLSEADESAVQIAERWAAEPTEKHRRDAQAVAEQLEFKTPAAWAAMAAFWSGGSMAPPNVPAVPPPPDLMPQALSGAVALAAVARTPERAEELQQRFLAFGLPGEAAGAA